VLKDIAYSLRKHLRAFDLAYRIGGEEFLIVLPGASVRRCADVAEELRKTIAESSFGDGVRLTMSFGVSASTAGTEFDYASVFAAADAALYDAKEMGRDRISVRPSPPGGPTDRSVGTPERARDLVTT
jgi:diguanylate cyclase (GGDEF)-like protein